METHHINQLKNKKLGLLNLEVRELEVLLIHQPHQSSRADDLRLCRTQFENHWATQVLIQESGYWVPWPLGHWSGKVLGRSSPGTHPSVDRETIHVHHPTALHNLPLARDDILGLAYNHPGVLGVFLDDISGGQILEMPTTNNLWKTIWSSSPAAGKNVTQSTPFVIWPPLPSDHPYLAAERNDIWPSPPFMGSSSPGSGEGCQQAQGSGILSRFCSSYIDCLPDSRMPTRRILGLW